MGPSPRIKKVHCKDFAVVDGPGKELALGLNHGALDLVGIKCWVAWVELNVVGRI